MRSKNLIPYIISFLLLTAVLIINQRAFDEMKRFAVEVDHARIVINSLSKLSAHLKSAELYTPTHEQQNKQYYNLYKTDALAINTELKHLLQEVKDNHGQLERVTTVDTLIRAQLPVLMTRNIAEIINDGERWRLAELFRIHALINQTSNVEISQLNRRKQKLTEFTNKSQTVTVIFSIIAFGLTISFFVYSLILARKRQWLEGFLESILNTTQNGIIYFRTKRAHGKIADFEVSFANAAVEKHLGIKQDDLTGKSLRRLGLPGKDNEVYRNFLKVIETEKNVEFEWKFGENNNEVLLFVTLAKLEDGLTATLQNITEIRQYQNELTKNIQNLEISNRELEQYAYVASHDLQEPLRKIRTYGTFLHEHQNQRLDEKGKVHLQKIIQAAERLSLLIRDILNFSSLRREQVFEPTDLNTVVNNVLEDIEMSVEQSNTVINVSPLPTIEAIPLQINQLLYNLITNAIKFTGKTTKPVINIRWRTLSADEAKSFARLHPDKAYCEIEIEDNGIGFNQAYANNIFGLFKRLNDQKSYPGSGIGLALCSKVVLNHHGEIYATSTEGQGAHFYVILPFQQ